MFVVIVLVIFALASQKSSAYPSMDDSILVKLDKVNINDSVDVIDQVILLRNRRQANDPRFRGNLNIDHSRQSGTNVYAQGQARVWRSDNGRNEVHANGQYGQHFGGPGGRSPPSYGGGLIYTHRF